MQRAFNTAFKKSCATLFPLERRNSSAPLLFIPSETASFRGEKIKPLERETPGGPIPPLKMEVAMKNMKKLLLGSALAIGALAMTPAPAHAARVGLFVGVGSPAAYIQPSPGPGYVWVNGYWANGVWVPGYWNFVGVGPAVGFGVRIGGPVVRVAPYHGYVRPAPRFDRFRR